VVGLHDKPCVTDMQFYSLYSLLYVAYAEFSCLICRQVMTLPITTPCAHNFCKLCLEGAFAGKTFVRERSRGGRALRSQKNVMSCPSCPTDISDFLQNPQVCHVYAHFHRFLTIATLFVPYFAFDS
jgi:hypothetical protein